MATETFLVTALPYSAAPAPKAGFHVSLFISPRLMPDGGESPLSTFPISSQWTKRVAQASFRLRGGHGTQVREIAVTPVLDNVLDPGLWAKVFPGSLPVRPWRTPDFTDTDWRSFPAHRMQAYAWINHAAAIWSSPLAPPGVAANPLCMGLIRLQTRMAQLRQGDRLHRPLLSDVIDGTHDRLLTGFLRELSGDGIVRPNQPGGALFGGPPRTDVLLRQCMADLQAACRYYQRPEDQQSEYHDKPIQNPPARPIAPPAPDFHERVGWLGDLSPLLRRLGLIIDLRVDDLSQLKGLEWIQGDLHWGHEPSPQALGRSRQPKTRCSLQGHSFTAVSTTGDYEQGLLKLGDETRFTLLDLDPDAAALKLEQYSRNLLRLAALEGNGDPVHSAPASLRATGFAIARIDRPLQLLSHLKDAPAQSKALEQGKGPLLGLEQVRRGLRLEVWDDVSRRWHSLHQRQLSLRLVGEGPILPDPIDDVGFLQGASLSRSDNAPDSDRYVHEVIAGWDGWSLSAPRPGLILAGEGEAAEGELLNRPPLVEEPINPVISTSVVQPGSLPMLRYGRSYSFRAFAVDLAGNSTPAEATTPLSAAEALQLMQQRWSRTALDASHVPGLSRGALGGDRLRRQLRALRPPAVSGPRAGANVVGVDPAGVTVTKLPELDRLIGARLTTQRQRRPAAGAIRANRIEQTFSAAAAASPHLLERTDLQPGPALAAETLAGLGLGAAGSTLFTLPRPFLRWDPVLEPAMVPRWAYSEGESLQRLVIRSGVRQTGPEAETLEISPPAAYRSELQSSHPELQLNWHDTCQRHLAPPKTSQLTCELHGAFDAAIGHQDDAAAVRRTLALSLLEAGSFLDARRADPNNPGETLDQPGATFHISPSADPPQHSTPVDLPHGKPPSRGQYVAHDVDAVGLPYLPDPLAAGLSLTFPDAGKDHRLTGLFAIEGTTLRFLGDWPQLQPFRLVLESGQQLGAVVEGHVLRISLPPGEQLRLRLSSALERTKLDLLGLWRLLPKALRTHPVLREAAADGWFWWLTPASEVRLVHAVPRPLELPRATLLRPVRQPDSTSIPLWGAIDVHGPSTERIDLEASWEESIDDPTKPTPEQRRLQAIACGTTVDYAEDLVVLSGQQELNLPQADGETLRLHAAVHEIGDTRHRRIHYRARATTRYREYFPAKLTATPDAISVLGPAITLAIPSTVRPAKVVVRDVLPLFRWEESTEPNQPFGLRRVRRAGLRIYLERPWYSSGDGELLALLLSPDPNDSLRGFVCRWGSDPVFLQQGPAQRGLLPLIDLLQLSGLDPRPEPGRPVGPPQRLPLMDHPDDTKPQVWTLSYMPEFCHERGLWRVDVAIDPGTAFWPFVQLAIARHQPEALDGLHLGPVTVCDFAQLPPERTATVSRSDETHVRVVVTGAVGVPDLPDPSPGLFVQPIRFLERLQQTRRMTVRLERYDANVGTDLGWATEALLELPVLGVDGTVVSWAGEMALPLALTPRTPGQPSEWRVCIEETELLPGDAEAGGSGGLQGRIVYADQICL